jgi:hypothetical protein
MSGNDEVTVGSGGVKQRSPVARHVVLVLVLVLVALGAYHSLRTLAPKTTTTTTAVAASGKKSIPLLVSSTLAGNVTITNSQLASSDLISFLQADVSGCLANPQYGNAWYSVAREVNKAQALVQYACQNNHVFTTSKVYLAAVKQGSAKSWLFTLPATDWVGSVPSCTMADTYKLSKKLTPACWTGSPSDTPLVTQAVTQS